MQSQTQPLFTHRYPILKQSSNNKSQLVVQFPSITSCTKRRTQLPVQPLTAAVSVHLVDVELVKLFYQFSTHELQSMG